MAADNRSPSPPLPPDPSQYSKPKPHPPGEAYNAPQTSPKKQSQRQSQTPGVARSRPQLDTSPVVHRPQEVQDAVNEAFDQSPATNQLDPEFIKQVTEQVIRNLQNANVAQATSSATSQPQQPQQHQVPSSQVPRSPTQSSVDSIPQRYTPPSPDHSRTRHGARDYPPSSPASSPSDSGGSAARQSNADLKRSESTKSRDTARLSNTRNRSGTWGSRQREGATEEVRPRTRDGGPSGMSGNKTPSQHSRSQTDVPSGESPRRRVRSSEAGSDPEVTILERIWQPLFDNGNPTMRLGQFLRGIALHLIEDYEPKSSLVITPQKMLRFFHETKTEDEHYPWEVIFGGQMTCASLSTMYRRLLCQHHLVQNQNHDVPFLPALTPCGFEWFLTCLIQAHPDTEFKRLAKTVMNMPISNSDDRTERFPKELSRRLLPAEASLQAEQRLISCLNHEPYLVGNLKGAAAMPPPPSTAPPQQSSFTERERQPYSQGAQQSNAIDDDDLAPPPVQLERERKPYSAKEGTGKFYAAEDLKPPLPHPNGSKMYSADDVRPATGQYRQDAALQGGSTRPSRTNSGAPVQPAYNSTGPSEAVNIPQRSSHRLSLGQSGLPPVPPATNGSYPKGGRRVSPPRNFYGRSNEPVDAGGMQPPPSGANIYPPYAPGDPREKFPNDPGDDTLRRYNSRPLGSRSTTNVAGSYDDDPGHTNSSRGRSIPPRSGVPIANSYEYGSNPVSDRPPVGTYPARPRPGGTDDRRRSMYNVSSSFSNGGSDGWGSFTANDSGPQGNAPPYPTSQSQQQQPSQSQQQSSHGSSGSATQR